MPTKDKIKNRKYIAKSRQKLIDSIGIDRKGRNIDIDELKEVQRELQPRKSKN